MATLEDIQTSIANEVDQSSTAPTQGGTDWLIRRNLINRSISDWGETYDWKSLLKTHNGRVSVAGLASYSLPADFKKLDGYPEITWDGVTTDQFAVIDASKRTQYSDSDRYTYVTGNSKNGNYLYIHANTLASGASVKFTYFAAPASLASATDVTDCPDPNFLIQRTLYYLYKAREDGRFPEAKAEADKILARMIENENALGQSHNDNRVQRWEESRYGFRIGRD
jgi:hypothetical protein